VSERRSRATTRSTRRDGRQDWRGQRGAVIVEAALVLPVILSLILGVMEFGFIWKDDLALANATRSAARVGAAAGKDQYADYNILQQIKSGTSALPANVIQRVIVWEANTTTTPPTQCKTAVGGYAQLSPPVYCNVYTGTEVASLTQASFASTCTGTGSYWCWSTRLNTQAGPPDYVGVYIQIDHKYITKILGTTRTLSDASIMRIEPIS
jgi:Flp pilus assembly protein TadG